MKALESGMANGTRRSAAARLRAGSVAKKKTRLPTRPKCSRRGSTRRKSPSRTPRPARRRDTPTISTRWGTTAGSRPLARTSRRKRVGKPGSSRVTCPKASRKARRAARAVGAPLLDRLQPGGHRGEPGLEDGDVEAALAPEVVADQGLVDPGARRHLLGRDPVEPPLGEEGRRRPAAGPAGWPLGPASPAPGASSWAPCSS